MSEKKLDIAELIPRIQKIQEEGNLNNSEMMGLLNQVNLYYLLSFSKTLLRDELKPFIANSNANSKTIRELEERLKRLEEK